MTTEDGRRSVASQGHSYVDFRAVIRLAAAAGIRPPGRRRNCATCGSIFIIRNSRHVYCCEHRDQKQRIRAKYRADRPLRQVECLGCGAPFLQNNLRHTHCKRGCGRVVVRILKPRIKKTIACPRCSKPFEPWSRDGKHARKFCSRACSARPKKLKSSPAWKQPQDCMCCLQLFVPKNARGACCSKACRQRYESRRRKARLRGVSPVVITVAHLFRRGDRNCGLCGQPVEKAHKYPSPMSATVDHIVPLSKGGAHHIDNTQLAHARCNMVKGNRYVA